MHLTLPPAWRLPCNLSRSICQQHQVRQRISSLLQVEQLMMGTPAADEAPQKLSLSEADDPSVIATTLLSGPGIS